MSDVPLDFAAVCAANQRVVYRVAVSVLRPAGRESEAADVGQ